ncbi:MAG: aminoacyl-tRNA hydrolase [Anaerolineales bacterium]|nr:aminoacyl-tRNA hydrolase [Anaerolineales bacterium]
MNKNAESYLIVGLGNPGKKHRMNRHNVGFMLLDMLAAECDLTFSRRKSKALITEWLFEGHKIILAKPQTYMNLSGRSVAPLLRFYRLPARHMLVAYDELDLPAGVIRMRPEGGTGGHRGMRSIIHELGSNAFPRIRIGIGRPPGRMDPADYVLTDFNSDEQEAITNVLARAAGCVRLFIGEGIQAAMTCCNTT